jgi:hypothetical protein
MKTDNSHFEEKVRLRALAITGMENIKVLECYAGMSTLWEEVKKRTGKRIEVTRIEKIKGKCPLPHLVGDNSKYLFAMDLDRYEIIDLDAYGIPAEQMEIIIEKGYKGTIIITAIQSVMGRMPDIVLKALGYTDGMIAKAPSLLCTNGLEKFLKYLYFNNIIGYKGYFFPKKYYFICKQEA